MAAVDNESCKQPFRRIASLRSKLSALYIYFIIRTNLWQGLSFDFHRERDDIFSADSDELLRFGDFILCIDNSQWDEEHHLSHSVNCLLELTLGGQLKNISKKG